MYNYMSNHKQNSKLQRQPQAVTISDLSISKVNSQEIIVSNDMDTNIDPVHGIAQVFSEPSNLDAQILRLQTQTRFVTPLSCDLEPDITKPTSRKIVVSDKTKLSKSDQSSFRKQTQLTKLAHLHQLMPLLCHIVRIAGIDSVDGDKISTITQSTSEDSINKSKTSRL